MVVIDQVQLGDVLANQQLHVVTTPASVSQATITVGNSGVGSADHAAVDYRGTQQLNADSHAVTVVAVDNSAGSQLSVVTSATGNTGTGGTCCAALTGTSTQTIAANHTVTAESYVNTDGPDTTGAVSINSAAIGNTQGWETNGGSVTASSTQTHYGETYAALGATIAGVDGAASYTATAVANNVTSDAASAPVSLTVSQQADGFRTRAGMEIVQQYGGDVTAAATASSNNINITATGGTASLGSNQFNTNPVQAETELTLGGWGGTATAASYGVANSAIVSNGGPATTANGVQTNSGEVTALTGFNGVDGNGGDAKVLSTAVGNAYSAYACADCNGSVVGTVRQTNSGGVSSTTNATTSNQGAITGVTTAVGNTATFQVHKP